MAINLRDPELTSDAQRFISFASAVAESYMTLKEFKLRNVDKESAEYKQLQEYCMKNATTLNELLQSVLNNVG